MACRVGMSTDPEGRIEHWKRVEGHTYSRILAEKLTYNQALAREQREARERGCKSSAGGNPVSGSRYAVYYVSGGR